MKSKAQIKDELHRLIDSIEDEGTLNLLNESLIPYAIEKKANDSGDEDELSEEETAALDQALLEADTGKVISLDEFLKEVDAWRTK